MPYAVVMGEALMDLMESRCEDEPVYRPMIGGAPLNVAVGLARLGAPVRFVASLGTDVIGQRIRGFLDEVGVDRQGCVDVDVPTTLAVTSLRDTVPEFHFYGQPASYGLLAPEHLDLDLIAGASTLYCGSIALLCAPTLAAARAAWAVPGPLRTLDPNVRPTLGDPAPLRPVIEEFAATADLVKLSEPDARALFDLDPDAAAGHLRDLGAGAVVVTLGPRGALVATGGELHEVSAPTVTAVDTTGAGDATMAGLTHGLLRHGLPTDPAGWRRLTRFALTVASIVCERPGGATAMPTIGEVHARLR